MTVHRNYSSECFICGKSLSGVIVEDFKEHLDLVSKSIDNIGLGIICPSCETVFCYEHKKDVGWKMLSGYNKAMCPKCHRPLKRNWELMSIVTEIASEDLTLEEKYERIPKLAEEKKHLEILDLIRTKEELEDHKIQEEMKKAFSGIEDEELILKIVEGVRGDKERLNIVKSLSAISFTAPDFAVKALSEIYDLNISIKVGSKNSSNFQSIAPLIQISLQEVGSEGSEQMLIEAEKRGSDGTFIRIITKTLNGFLNEENWLSVTELMENSNSNLIRIYLIQLLEGKGWTPTTDKQRALSFIVHKDWKELRGMGASAHSGIVKYLSCPIVDFSERKLKKILSEI